MKETGDIAQSCDAFLCLLMIPREQLFLGLFFSSAGRQEKEFEFL